jgi:hypothetical protein
LFKRLINHKQLHQKLKLSNFNFIGIPLGHLIGLNFNKEFFHLDFLKIHKFIFLFKKSSFLKRNFGIYIFFQHIFSFLFKTYQKNV